MIEAATLTNEELHEEALTIKLCSKTHQQKRVNQSFELLQKHFIVHINYLAKRYRTNRLTKDDLRQVGLLALYQSCLQYDGSVPFGAFGYQSIKYRVLDEVQALKSKGNSFITKAAHLDSLQIADKEIEINEEVQIKVQKLRRKLSDFEQDVITAAINVIDSDSLYSEILKELKGEGYRISYKIVDNAWQRIRKKAGCKKKKRRKLIKRVKRHEIY